MLLALIPLSSPASPAEKVHPIACISISVSQGRGSGALRAWWRSDVACCASADRDGRESERVGRHRVACLGASTVGAQY